MNLPLQEDNYYHIYNRANGSEKIFVDKDNYRYFLEKYKQHVSPIADTYAYCLMPNHFHFLVRIKSEKEVRAALAGGGAQNVPGSSALQNVPGFKNLGGFSANDGRFNTRTNYDSWPLEKILSKQLSNFFNAYTKAFNKQQNRMGSLFIKNFKRKKIEDMTYMKNLIEYIHNNPLEAKMVKLLKDFEYSSYRLIEANDNDFVKSSDVLEWYYDLYNFRAMHSLKNGVVLE